MLGNLACFHSNSYYGNDVHNIYTSILATPSWADSIVLLPFFINSRTAFADNSLFQEQPYFGKENLDFSDI